MFKVNNKDLRTMKIASFWCLNCWLWTDFTRYSSAFLFDVEQVNVDFINFNLHGNALHGKQTNQRRIADPHIIYDEALCGNIMSGSHYIPWKQHQYKWCRNRRPASVFCYLQFPWQNWKHCGRQRHRWLRHFSYWYLLSFFGARNITYCLLCWETVALW